MHLAALKWNIAQCRFGLDACDLERLQTSSVELLELLKSNLPEKSGGATGWKFEKAHSILHKVREIIMFGWSENYSTQVHSNCLINSHVNSYVNSYVYRPVMC